MKSINAVSVNHIQGSRLKSLFSVLVLAGMVIAIAPNASASCQHSEGGESAEGGHSCPMSCPHHAKHAAKDGSEETSSKTSVSGVMFASAEKVQKETGEAVDATLEYANANKKEFSRKMKKELTSLKTEMENLEKKARVATGEARVELDRRLAVLKEKREGLSKDLEKASNVSARTWNVVKKGLVEAMTDLKEAYYEAKDELKKEDVKEEKATRE